MNVNINPFLKRHKNKLSLAILIILQVSAISLYVCNRIVSQETAPFIYANRDSIPANKVGLLLGTNKYIKSGYPNYYFTYRIDAAAELFHAGKIERIIVSGDNSRKEYNEAEYMRTALIEKGVPDSCIYLDYAGFRTYDSMLRCREIFGQTRYTVISQRFHNERAIFLARNKGMDVIGYDARDVKTYNGIRTKIRERFARVKVFLDLYVLNTQPRFLGDKVEVK